MAKLADNINSLLAAAGVKLTEEQKVVLAELPQDEVSAPIQSFFDTATNTAGNEFANLVKKAGNLDKFDEGFAGWADILGDDIKGIAKEKGPQKLEKIKAQIAKKFEEAKTAAAGGSGDLEKLRAEILTLQTKQQTAEAEHAAALEAQKGDYESRMFNSDLLTKLQGRTDIIDAFKNPDALKLLVLPKVLEWVKGKGLEIKPDTLDIVNATTKVPHQKDAKPVTLEDIFGEALSENKFRQNAGPTPPKSTMEMEGGDSPKVTRASVLRPGIRE